MTDPADAIRPPDPGAEAREDRLPPAAPPRRKLGRRALSRLRARVRHLPPLPAWLRVVLGLFGWILILLGLIQIVTPGPGTLFMLAGAALLSLVSRRIHDLLRRLFRPWPKGWRMLLQIRRRFRFWLHTRFSRRPRKAP